MPGRPAHSADYQASRGSGCRFFEQRPAGAREVVFTANFLAELRKRGDLRADRLGEGRGNTGHSVEGEKLALQQGLVGHDGAECAPRAGVLAAEEERLGGGGADDGVAIVEEFDKAL